VLVIVCLNVASGAGLFHGDRKHLRVDLLIAFAVALSAAVLSVPIVRRVVRRRSGVQMRLSSALVTAMMAGVFLVPYAWPLSLLLYLVAWVACARFARGNATLHEHERV